MQLGSSKKSSKKPLIIWNRTFTLYLKILIIDKKRVYDDDIWKSQCLFAGSGGGGGGGDFFQPYRIVTILYRCTGFVAKGGVGALFIYIYTYIT